MTTRVALVALLGLSIAGWPTPPVSRADSLEDFECKGEARHIFTNTKAADSSYEMTEHYCELPNGKRRGATKISYTDLTGVNPSTYTWGHLLSGRRAGRWTTVTVTGELVGDCFYANGRLLYEVGTCDEG